MSSTHAVELWFEFASTYSYPAASRIGACAERAGVAVRYRPFLLGPIFRDQGWSDSPFNLQPAKGRYMWRDLERICAREGLPFARPSVFPRNGLLAARLATAAADEPWLPELVRRVYRLNFADDGDISDPAALLPLLDAIDPPGARWLDRAAQADVKAALRASTERARSLGLFGAPSFVVDGELFWGNDRLEEALDAAR